MNGCIDGLAHRALVFEPLFAGDEAEPVAFGARVVLVDHRTPPVDHFFFDGDGAGGSGMDGDLHAGNIEAGSLRLR